jgi:2'-hydroxyisoflavone reductase
VEFLQEHQIRGWSDMPVWVAPRADNAGFSRVSIQRALDAGLTFRPLSQTARATVDWLDNAPSQKWYQDMNEAARARLAGPFTPEREAAALRAWHARADA